jgi:hypothetical protein
MARPGLDKWEVKRARDDLAAQGRYPSVDAVRAALGNTGSKSTIHKYLKELESDSGEAGGRRVDTAATIQSLVDSLSAELHASADREVDEMTAIHAAVMLRSEADIAALRAQVAALTFQLTQAEKTIRNLEAQQGSGSGWDVRTTRPGFGAFGVLVCNDRSVRGGLSAFSSLFDSRSRAVDHASAQREAQGSFWLA